MSAIADGLRVSPDNFEQTGQQNVMRPVYGSLKDISVKIEKHKEYASATSAVSGKEEYKETDIALFKLDKFSEIPVPLKELSTKQTRDLSSLINAYSNQSETDETKILDWQAISPLEKQFVIEMQIYSVEQLSHFPEVEAFRLGQSGKDVIKKAKRHVETKQEEKREKEENLESVKVLRAELEALKTQLLAKPATVDPLEQEAAKAKKAVK